MDEHEEALEKLRAVFRKNPEKVFAWKFNLEVLIKGIILKSYTNINRQDATNIGITTADRFMLDVFGVSEDEGKRNIIKKNG